MDLTGQSGGTSGMPEAVGQGSNCNVSNCPTPYGCTGPSGGKGGVGEHDKAIQLINRNLTILPYIKNFKRLTSLVISSDNGMIDQHSPSEFRQLTDIKNLVDLPNEIEYLTGLQSLTLQKIPNLKDLSDKSRGKLINLQELMLNILPNISNLPLTMNNFQLLQTFTLIQMNIENIKLTNLNNLSILKNI